MVGQSNIQHSHHWKHFYRKLRILTPKGGSGEYLAEMRACARLKEPGYNRVPATGHLDTIQAHFPSELRASHKWYSLGTTWPTDFCKSPKLGWPPHTHPTHPFSMHFSFDWKWPSHTASHPFSLYFLSIGSDPPTTPTLFETSPKILGNLLFKSSLK